MKTKKPTLKQWKALYEAAGEIKKVKPWDYLYDMDIVTLMPPEGKEPVFCSIMGMAGQCYGIGLYFGYEALTSLYRMIDNGGDALGSTTYLNCITLYFGSRQELHPEDYETIRALGLRFRGDNQWPFFRSHETGYFPWYLSGKEAVGATRALKLLAEAVEGMKAQKLKVDFEGGETLVYRPNPEGKGWLAEATAMPLLPIQTTTYTMSDELLLSRLKKRPRKKKTLEVSANFLGMPFQEGPEEKPRLPRLLFFVDQQSQMIEDTQLSAGERPYEELLLDMLIDFILEEGRPQKILVKDDILEGIFSDLCEKLDIELKRDPYLPGAAQAEAELISHMSEFPF